MIIRELLLVLTVSIALLSACVVPTAPPAPAHESSAARNLTGTWTGSGVYYQLDLSGNRVLKVTCDVVMTLQQTDNQVRGTLDVYPAKQEPTGRGNWVPEVEGHSIVDGNAVITTLTFSVGSKVAGSKEKWEFTFTTDLMSGHVTNLDTTYYAGRDSDHNAFQLMREGGQVTPKPSGAQSPAHKPILALPPGIPPKPPSLLASNAEYFIIYTTCDSWGYDFYSGYDKGTKNAAINQWSGFWMGSKEDESKRIYFERAGDKWKPRNIPPLPLGTPPKPDSLLAGDAEYYLIYTIFNSWFGEDTFNTAYEQYSEEGMINNGSVFWIGSKTEENKRIYFDRVGDRWEIRAMPEPSTPTPATPATPQSSVQIWEIVDETGHTATLTVDSNGNFAGSGWVGSTPSGTYDIPITSGIMSGTSMNFRTSASYDNGQGTITGTGSGTLNEPFPFAKSASGVWSGTISDPLGTRTFSIKWTAIRKPE